MFETVILSPELLVMLFLLFLVNKGLYSTAVYAVSQKVITNLTQPTLNPCLYKCSLCTKWHFIGLRICHKPIEAYHNTTVVFANASVMPS